MPMTDVGANDADFEAVARKGRRNALADVLDEDVTKTTVKSLVETLTKLHSIDHPDVDSPSTDDSTATDNAQKSSSPSSSSGDVVDNHDHVVSQDSNQAER